MKTVANKEMEETLISENLEQMMEIKRSELDRSLRKKLAYLKANKWKLISSSRLQGPKGKTLSLDQAFFYQSGLDDGLKEGLDTPIKSRSPVKKQVSNPKTLSPVKRKPPTKRRRQTTAAKKPRRQTTMRQKVMALKLSDTESVDLDFEENDSKHSDSESQEEFTDPWPPLKSVGFKYVHGNLEHSFLYLRPGTKKANGIMDVTMFGQEGLADYYKKHRDLIDAGILPPLEGEEQPAPVKQTPAVIIAEDSVESSPSKEEEKTEEIEQKEDKKEQKSLVKNIFKAQKDVPMENEEEESRFSFHGLQEPTGALDMTEPTQNSIGFDSMMNYEASYGA